MLINYFLHYSITYLYPILGQKAPSAKRCIKTVELRAARNGQLVGQKAPSAKRCIKT